MSSGIINQGWKKETTTPVAFICFNWPFSFPAKISFYTIEYFDWIGDCWKEVYFLNFPSRGSFNNHHSNFSLPNIHRYVPALSSFIHEKRRINMKKYWNNLKMRNVKMWTQFLWRIIDSILNFTFLSAFLN